MDDNLFHLVRKYLIYNSCSFNENHLRLRLLSDPNNKIVAITNTLDYFKIKNVVVQVPKNSIEKLPLSFLTLMENSDGTDIVLAVKAGNKIKLFVNAVKYYLMEIENFIQEWTGIVIALEDGNKVTAKKFYLNKYWTIISAIILLGATIVFYQNNIWFSLYFLLSVGGFILTLLAIQEEMDLNTPFISKFCTLSKSTNCKTVIGSKKAKLFDKIGLSDLGIIYFSTLVFSVFFSSAVGFLFFLSILALPITIYSIYFQYRIVKKWCPLCLGIITVLWLQMLVLLPMVNNVFLDIGYSVFYFCFIAICFSLLWFFIKPLLTLKQEQLSLEMENLSFRRNYHLFLPLYEKQEQINIALEKDCSIKLGNPGAKLTITAVTNPLCETCFQVHHIYQKILNQFPGEVQIDMRFYVPFKDRKDARTQIAERLLQLYKEEDTNTFFTAMEEWFQLGNKEKWLNKWKACNNELYNDFLGMHKNWCSKHFVDSSPAIFLNGKRFPLFYRPIDIDNFIEPILDSINSIKEKKVSQEIIV